MPASLILPLLRGRRRRLALVGVCLAIGVAAFVAVGGLVAGLRAALAQEGRAMLGGDCEVTSQRPLTAEQVEACRRRLPAGSAEARVRELLAMAGSPSGTAARLVQLGAVDAAWPLAGRLTVSAGAGVEALRGGQPAVLVAPDLLPALGVVLGGTIRIGALPCRVAGVIGDEPGVPPSPFTLGPRVLIGLPHLAATGLDGLGTRARDRLLIALPDPAAAVAVAEGLKDALALPAEWRTSDQGPMGPSAGLAVRTAADVQGAAGRAYERFADYLRLAALLALLLGGLGVAGLSRALAADLAPDLAVLRVLGMGRGRAAALGLGMVMSVALAGSLAGALIGAAVPPLLSASGLLGLPWQPAIPWSAAASGIAVALVVAATAAGAPLLALRRLAPLAVLRGESVPAPGVIEAAAVLLAGAALLALAAAWAAHSWMLGPGLVATSLAAVLVLAWAGTQAVRLLAHLRQGVRAFAPAHALAALAAPGAAPGLAIAALGTAGLLLGLLAAYRASLLAELAPARAGGMPCAFVIDVQPDQLDGVRVVLAAQGATTPDLAPVVRARYLGRAGGDAAADGSTREAEHARHFRTREQNLSWRDAPGADETLIEGRWADPAGAECTLEERFARRLGVGLGDRLRFRIQGDELALTVVGLRRVRWLGLRPNFFILASRAALAEAPTTWIAAVPPLPDAARRGLAPALLAAQPTVTVIDLHEVVAKVAALVERIAVAVGALALCAGAAGLASVAGLAFASAARRRGESALLAALGAGPGLRLAALAIESALVGLVAGLLALPLAAIAAQAVLGGMFDLAVVRPWGQWAAILAGLALASALAGVLACWRAALVPPLAVLRDEV